ncbi:OmpA family protein [Pseudophaeobacter flagellatus]|uniref:OmpA family protein n=1 Tax=Pseudophaeobacter flagellatus TaxID=2899119 RepID=UPI001E320D62|nr:OmpA family protein [Pseudophaeobacter flagellatus]MCD9149669.1 OmpA family protein [Pseudophaeobacter flagellatus]
MVRLNLRPLLALLLLAAQPALALDPFEHGWQLDPEASAITFLSVKKDTIAETSQFATISGQITEGGIAQLVVALDSVDTKIDLRNVRMRFLFFETFTHPEARVTAVLDPTQLLDLPQRHRKVIEVPVTLSLHGVEMDLAAKVAVTLLDNDRVNISTLNPVILQLADFNLMEGREKLQEAANVTITPLGIVNLNLTFDRRAAGTPVLPTAAASGATAALEATGDFSRAACIGRFDILSRSRSVNFAPGTSRLDQRSTQFLDSLFDIVSRCPNMVIEVGGHTDDKGSEAANTRLSQRRAASVVSYLATKGIATERLKPVGYGEASPLVANSNAQNRAKNRRIAFKVLN